MKEVYNNIIKNINDDTSALKVVQKLLISSISERDYSSQVNCHLLLQLPLIKSTRYFIILSDSLDGSHQVENQLDDATNIVTKASILDHYIQHPTDDHFEKMTLLHFAQNYSMSKHTKLQKMKIVFPNVEAVADYNINKFHACGQPIATIIKAVHSGPNACNGYSDDASGLEPFCLCNGARVMLSL
jgi:hypothetical protein